MNTMQRVLLAAALISVTAVTVSAQQRGRGRGFGFGFGGPISLVTLAANDAVQKDLGVSADVAGKLNALRDEYNSASDRERRAAGLDFQSLQNLSDDERRAKMQEFATKGAQITTKLNEEFLPKLKAIISEDEIGRLKQIQIQQQGAAALTNADVAAELKLNDEQKAKLADIQAGYTRQQGELLRGDGDAQQRFARLRELGTERDNKSLDVLTAEQKEKFAALKGSPFDVSQLGFGGRGRRGNN